MRSFSLQVAPLFGYLGAASALVFSCEGWGKGSGLGEAFGGAGWVHCGCMELFTA